MTRALFPVVAVLLSTAAVLAETSDVRMRSPNDGGILAPAVFDQASAAPVAPPAVRGARGGGDNCGSATAISNLPFTDTGNTCSATDDFYYPCPATGMNSPDVVYSFTPAEAMTVDISTCDGTDFDSQLLVYMDSCGGTPYGCNNDFCAGASKISNVPLSAGHTYYIVVDGSSSCGNYTLAVTAPPPPPMCPAESLFSQSPNKPTESWSFSGSDVDYSGTPLKRFENYSGVGNPICSVTWWGITAYWGGYTWYECTENPVDFAIEFYADAGGRPDTTPIYSYTATVTGTPTGVRFNGIEMIEYTVDLSTLPTGCAILTNGWVSIQASGGPDCWFLWGAQTPGDPSGDGSWVLGGTTMLHETWNLSLCLGGPIQDVYGACCDEFAGTCSAGVLLSNCTNPGTRFSPNQPGNPATCDRFVPACGSVTGACCRPDDTCDMVLSSQCMDGTWLGPNATCDACPCIAPCPSGGIDENEPCGGAMVNDGCWLDPPLFTPVECGTTYCGTAWNNLMGRDLDWYSITITEPTIFTWAGESEFDGFIIGLNEQYVPGEPGCANYTGYVYPSASGDACQPLSVTTACLPPGEYSFFAAVGQYVQVLCGPSDRYTVTLTCETCTIPTGACCFQDETCAVLYADRCWQQGGLSWTEGAACDETICLLPRGACCQLDGSCVEKLTQYECDDLPDKLEWHEGLDCATAQCPQPLPNDYCESAEIITAVPFETTFDNATAFTSPISCMTYYSTTRGDLWWRYTPQEDCYVTLDVADLDMGYDMVLGIYRGSDCTSLTNLFCIDYPQPFLVEFQALGGATYWFQIGVYGSYGTGGLTHFSLDCGESPTGACCVNHACAGVLNEAQCTELGGGWRKDMTCEQADCANGDGTDCGTAKAVAAESASLPFSDSGTTCGKVKNFENTCLEYYDTGEDIIYQLDVTAPICLNMTVETSSWVGLALDAVCPPGTNCLAYGTSTDGTVTLTNVELAAGTYYLMIDSWWPDCTSFTLTISECPPPPANDLCENAICVEQGTYTGSNAVASGDDLTSCTESDTTDVWFKYTPAVSGPFEINTYDSGFDTSLAIFDACGGTELACNNDAPYSLSSAITFDGLAGQTILIRLAGRYGETGVYILNILGGEGTCWPDCNANGVPDPWDLAAGTSRDYNGTGVPDECEGLGDLNCDGVTDYSDINPFVLRLVNAPEYANQYPDCPDENADINGNGDVGFNDINPFVDLLLGR